MSAIQTLKGLDPKEIQFKLDTAKENLKAELFSKHKTLLQELHGEMIKQHMGSFSLALSPTYITCAGTANESQELINELNMLLGDWYVIIPHDIPIRKDNLRREYTLAFKLK